MLRKSLHSKGDVASYARDEEEMQPKRRNSLVLTLFCLCVSLCTITFKFSIAVTDGPDWAQSATNDAPLWDRLLFATSSFMGKEDSNIDVRTLWLITCETRSDSPTFAPWNSSAHRFLQRQNKLPRLNATTDTETFGDTKAVWRPRVHNVCDNAPVWDGFQTKIRAVLNFVNETDADNSPRPKDVVMFTDSDAIFNSFAWTVDQVIQQFEHARIGRPILASAEPVCFASGRCNSTYIQWLYPNATKRSNCPQFLNSGQYMGYPEALKDMLHWIVDKVTRCDQTWFAEYRTRNPGLVALDTKASVFRSMSFGMIDASAKGPRTCGTDGIRDCGSFHPYKSASLDAATGEIVMEAVPGGCRESSRPFSIHFPGATRDASTRIARAMNKFAASTTAR